jgi:predicted GIY-YIG superfamily endonuclease
MKVYIYTLEHPVTKEVRYIGKTKNPKERFHNHCNRLHNEHTHKRNWINSLRNQGLKPKMNILDEVTESEWKYWEKFWIEQFRQWGFNLVNHTSGGDGLTTGNQTSFKKGHKPWNCGTAKPKILKGDKGKTENSIKTQFKKGHVPWCKGIKRGTSPKCIPILQYDLQDNFIKEHLSCTHAAQELKCIPENIRRACVGLSKTAKNYKWKYKNQ